MLGTDNICKLRHSLAVLWRMRGGRRSNYHPMNKLRRYWKASFRSGLVNISAICSLVFVYSMVMSPLTTCERKCQSLTDRCLVRGRNFGFLATSMQAELSSKVRHRIFGCVKGTVMFLDLSSLSNSIMEMTSRSAVERAMISASVVESAISD